MTVIPIRPVPAGDQLDRLPALWNTSSSNPDVKARQQRSEETTRFQIQHDPDYAAELAKLRTWAATYEIPLKEDA